MDSSLVKEIKRLANRIGTQITIMQLCGTHTEAIARFAIKKLIPKNIKLLAGPGCPVCVTDQEDINIIIAMSLNKIPIACYGDILKVPGNLNLKRLNVLLKIAPFLNRDERNFSLDRARELGADITEVYSIEEAIKLKKQKPNLVFFGIGFETTTPMSAFAIKSGLTVYSSHKCFLKAMQALIDDNLKIDGFINPGHVSTITGIKPYKKLRFKRKKIPQIITGFLAKDILLAIYLILKQIREKRADVENEYQRAVKLEGNLEALKLIKEVFELKNSKWRGLGEIPKSGFEIRKRYSCFDAKRIYRKLINKIKLIETHPQNSCICGAILRGLKEPKECPLFNKECSPENPIGPCMVSFEGSCGIAVKFNED